MTVEHAHLDNRTGNTRRQTQRRVAHVGSLLAEDGAKQLLFRRHRAFALRRDLADEDVARVHLGADVNDASLVEVAQRFFTDVRDVAGDVFRPQLRVAGHHLELFDVDRGEDVFLHDPLGDEDGVFVVVAVPRHERDEDVAAQRQFTQFGGRTVGDDVALGHHVTHLHQRTLVDAGVLVGTLELQQGVDVHRRLARLHVFRGADHDTGGVHLVDDAAAAGRDGSTRVTGNRGFHAGADERRFGADKRHGLTLHVRAHERAVRVVVFQERNERRCNRHQLLRADVHEGDLLARSDQEFTGLTGGDQLFSQHAVFIGQGVGLSDGVALLFHGRQVQHLVGHLAVDHLAVRRLDEAVLVDAAIGGQRVDQTDVRTFRGLNRADTAVVGRVDVADFEACALAGQTARAKCRDATLVRHFRQRVGLVHELRQLRGAKELTHSGHGRLGVDEVVRHHGVDVHRRHALLHGALHAQQADAVLVFQQLAHRTHAAVAEVVDVVDFALAVLQVDQGADDREDVVLAQNGHIVRAFQLQAHVHLHAAHGRQVVALRIEEQAVEQAFGGLAGRRLARAHDAVDFGQSVVTLFDLVRHQRIAQPRTDVDMVDVEHVETVETGGVELGKVVLAHLVTGLDVDLAGLLVDHVVSGVTAEDLFGRNQQLGQAVVGSLAGGARRDLLVGREHDLAGAGVDHVEHRLLATPLIGDERHAPAIGGALPGHAIVEVVENLFRVQAQGIEQRRDRQLALAVDTDVDDVLGVEFKVQPRTAIRNHAGGEQILARGVGLALVVVEEHARRTVHLGDDDALGAVDDERAVLGHERHVAHVHVLLLDIEHGTGAGVLIHFENDQTQGHAHRRGIGHATLTALVNVVLRVFKLVANEIQLGGTGKVADRENRPQRLFQTGHVVGHRAQELLVALALHFDKVRHLHDLADTAEGLADALASRERRRLGGHGCVRPRSFRSIAGLRR